MKASTFVIKYIDPVEEFFKKRDYAHNPVFEAHLLFK